MSPKELKEGKDIKDPKETKMLTCTGKKNVLVERVKRSERGKKRKKEVNRYI